MRDLNARSHLSCDRGKNTGDARRDEGRCLRRPGRLLGLRLCHDDRRQFPEDRAIEDELWSSARKRSRAFSIGRTARRACSSVTAQALWCSRRSRSTERAEIGASSRRGSDPMGGTRICFTSTAGPGSTKTVGHLRMNGREVFRHAVQKISGVIEETLVETGYARRRDRSLHSASGEQAHPRRHRQKAWRGAREDRDDARTSTATRRRRQSRWRSTRPSRPTGSRREASILMEAMGGGFTWGAVLARW